MQQGGDFLAQGVVGCVFRPPVPCTNSKSVSENVVGKIIKYKDAAKSEIEQQELISSLDPQHKFSVPYFGSCTVSRQQLALQKDARKCRLVLRLPLLRKKYQQLLLQDGGISVQSMVDGPIPFSVASHLFRAFGNVLRGIRDLQMQGYCHLDLHAGNVLYDPARQLMVLNDFGWLSKMNDIFVANTTIKKSFLRIRLPHHPPEMQVFMNRSVMTKNMPKSSRAQITRFINTVRLKASKLSRELVFREFADKCDVFMAGTVLQDLVSAVQRPIALHHRNEFFAMEELALSMLNMNPYERISAEEAIHYHDSICKLSKKQKI